MKIALVCSNGGHLFELYSLKEFWSRDERFWVTFKGQDTSVILSAEKVYFAFSPTNRNIINLIRNFFLGLKILSKEKPGVVISTGAGVGVAFIYAAKCLRIKTIYIELVTRIETLSLTGRLIYGIVDELIVQWPGLTKKYKKAKFLGQTL
ncbi:MAG: PssD/Cps14F family polysaccharide biosynthesis glycosyltransferase [Candidatus Omnitrophota bacterium]